MKKQFLYLLFLGSLFAFTNGCRKPCHEPSPTTFLLPAEVLDYVDFKTGSYWIYRDSANGAVDSVPVLNSQHVFNNDSGYSPCNNNLILIRQFENVEVSTRHYDSTGHASDLWTLTFDNQIKNVDASSRIFYVRGMVFTFAYPFRDYSFLNEKHDEYFIDSLEVAGKIYSHVLKVETIYPTSNLPAIYTNYYVAGIGVVSYRHTDPQNHSERKDLVRYNIIR
jgi:hypothetical protein